MWFSPQITEGTLAPIQALVGEELFRNSLPAGDYAQGGLNGIWQGRTYTHDTEVPLSQNQGTSTAEIPLVINLTMPLNNFYVFLKSLSFKIDTQSAGNPITTSISSTSSTSSVYSTSSTSSISRSFSASHFSSTSVLSSSGPTIASQPKKDHTAQIVAAVMGVLALCAFIALGFFFFRMKQRKHKRPEVTTDNVPITPLNHPTNTETPPIRDIKPMAPIRATHESRHPAFVRSL
ncbi:hypothetical protein FRC17_004158 [Serendipita sp. 399]|nr:hypothetical protein FRC17_004158 [Serendipita sp. 399]